MSIRMFQKGGTFCEMIKLLSFYSLLNSEFWHCSLQNSPLNIPQGSWKQKELERFEKKGGKVTFHDSFFV